MRWNADHLNAVGYSKCSSFGWVYRSQYSSFMLSVTIKHEPFIHIIWNKNSWNASRRKKNRSWSIDPFLVPQSFVYGKTSGRRSQWCKAVKDFTRHWHMLGGWLTQMIRFYKNYNNICLYRKDALKYLFHVQQEYCKLYLFETKNYVFILYFRLTFHEESYETTNAETLFHSCWSISCTIKNSLCVKKYNLSCLKTYPLHA